MNTPSRRERRAARAKLPEFVGRYLAVAAVFAGLAVVLALGWTGWAPTTWMDGLTVVGLTPAGVAGVLLGDRFGSWLKDHGIGRQ